MRFLRTICAVSFLGSFAAGFASCDKVDEVFDCQSVCDRYQSCFDSKYDTSQCRTNCRANSDKDPSFRAKADACDKCIGDKSCAGATFSCATECAGIVP